MNYYEIAPTALVRAESITFTYSSDGQLEVGRLVIISVGKKQHTGVVMGQAAKPEYQVKPLEKALDLPPIPGELLASAHWISEYYATHFAHVLRTILPSGLTKNRRKSSADNRGIARKRTNFVLNEYQRKAVNLAVSISGGSMLLHGVTGSGKTAVYIESIRTAYESGKSSIVLVPEIALTSQLVAEFAAHFPNVVVTHSRQTEAERHKQWQQVLQSTEPQVIIGPRSALFMPVSNLGYIVVDECHEPTFKQEKSPRYSALQVANNLATHHKACAILGSATPTISDYYRFKTKNLHLAKLPTPAQPDSISPTVASVDMTKRESFSQHRFLSDQLLKELESALKDGKQALLYHNRRGTASTTLCETCGWSAGCPRCFIPLTLHNDKHSLSCHTCGYKAKVPTSCPECDGIDIIHKGIGTKLIEQEVSKLFPRVSIARFDGDTESTETLEKRYQEVYDGKIQILVGTQILAKGLDLPHLRVVGVVQADAGLSLPDFSSSERTFQLLSQVVGRVGRSHHATKVILQTYQPSHPAITDGVKQDYQSFYERTIAMREKTVFPPFCHLLKLTCIYKTESAAVKNAKILMQKLELKKDKSIKLLGPTPAFYERQHDTYRWQIVVKSVDRNKLLQLLELLPTSHWQYEIDPSSLL